jgi:hypothetical protein
VAGLAGLSLGFVAGGLCFWHNDVYWFTPYAWWLFSLLQAFGLLITIMAADVDANVFLKNRKGLVLALVVPWIGGAVVLYSLNFSKVYSLNGLPFAYLLLRFRSILDMQPGFLTFTELICIILVTDDRVADSAFFFLSADDVTLTHVEGPLPAITCGSTDALGVAFMLLIYRSARSANAVSEYVIAQQQHSKTRSLGALIWVYMLVVGLVYGVEAWVFIHICEWSSKCSSIYVSGLPSCTSSIRLHKS